MKGSSRFRKLKDVYDTYRLYEENSSAQTLREAFHCLSLFPSMSQVCEMIECARGHQNDTREKVTYGEFCILVTELTNLYRNQRDFPKYQLLKKCRPFEFEYLIREDTYTNFQVFLGGSCNPTTWRRDVAIPFLKSHEITFYNPQVPNWKPEMIELEAEAKQNADVLFFVIDHETRATVSKIEVAYLAGQGRKIVLVIIESSKNCEIAGEKLFDYEKEVLNKSNTVLYDLIERQSVPVFSDIHSALHCVPDCVNKGADISDMWKKQKGRVCHGHLTVGRELLHLHNAFSSVDSNNTGALLFSELQLAYKYVMPDTLRREHLDKSIKSDTSFAFDDFCRLIAERKYLMQRPSMVKNFISRLLTPLKWILGLTPKSDQQNLAKYDVFIGGSLCEPDWRLQCAIPILRKHSITYTTRPVRLSSQQHLLPSDSLCRESCRVQLLFITAENLACDSMIEAAYHIGQGCRVVLCIQKLTADSKPNGNVLSSRAAEDYNRGRLYLLDIANRAGQPCFSNVPESVAATVKLILDLRSVS